MRRAAAYALFALVVATLMLPALAAPPMAHDSFWIDTAWSEQFTALLRQGNPYPRWLPWSFGGLGAPVFYFYAPGAFYLAGLFGLAGLATYPALLAAFAAAWFGSGAAMLAWLEGRTARPVVGALLYMVLPYHVIDFYARGAIAEFCAIALVPLVALGVAQASERGRAWPLMLAYAALIVTHLPTALLAAILLIAPLAVMRLHGLGAVAWGIAGAIGLAAPYLVPSLTLQHHASLASLWAVPFLQPANWSLLHPHPAVSRSYLFLFGGLAGASAVAAVLLARGQRSFWGWYVVAVAAIVTGLLPGFWSLPGVRAVQFPWRALAFAEFGLATLVAERRGSPVAAAAVLAPFLALATLMLSPANPLNGETMHPLPIPGRQDVIEYLPAGAVAAGREPRLDRLRAAVAIARTGPERLFAFPSLRARCGSARAPLAQDRATPLLLVVPAGCRPAVARLPAEWIGLALALATAAAAAVRARLSSAGRASTEARRAARAAPRDRPSRPPTRSATAPSARAPSA